MPRGVPKGRAPLACGAALTPRRALVLALLAAALATPGLGAEPAAEPPRTARPQRPSSELERARTALRAGRLDEARAGFEAWLTGHPADADALVGAGFTALRQDRIEAARALFERALAASPGYADAHFGVALADERTGRLEAARAGVHRALGLAPGRDEFRPCRRGSARPRPRCRRWCAPARSGSTTASPGPAASSDARATAGSRSS